MKKVKTTKLTAFDVDETLVMHDLWDPDASGCFIEIEGVRFKVHKRHVEQVKGHKARGHTVMVWSKGGADWAETVVRRLGLERHVDWVVDKPHWCYDDSQKWVEWIYLEDNK